jgi:hypothetical protein
MEFQLPADTLINAIAMDTLKSQGTFELSYLEGIELWCLE